LVPRVTDLPEPELAGVLVLEFEAGVELELEELVELDELLPHAASSSSALSTARSVRATRTAGGRG
jgi:hypothetical protein